MGVDPDYMLIWDGEYGFGGASDDIAGATFAKVYVDYAVSETVSLNGAFSFLDSNQESKGAALNEWDGASGYEINVGGKVKITDNVAWDFGLGYGQLDREDPTTPLVKEDPDATTKFYHRIKYTF
jgi:hypothetical protein